MLHGRFLLFNPTDLGHARSDIQVSGKLIEQFRVAHGIDVDGAVGFVANPPGESQISGP